MSKVKVERRRKGSFFVNFPRGNGMYDRYMWNGAKANYKDIKEIPADVVNWLAHQTSTLADGHLVVVEEENMSQEAQQVVENIKEEVKDIDTKTHTYEEIKELLTGHLTNEKKATLSKIETREEKEFVLEVAKDMKLDSVVKQKFIAEMLDVDVDMIF